MEIRVIDFANPSAKWDGYHKILQDYVFKTVLVTSSRMLTTGDASKAATDKYQSTQITAQTSVSSNAPLSPISSLKTRPTAVY